MAQRKTRRRCPNGSRKNKKTNQCDPEKEEESREEESLEEELG